MWLTLAITILTYLMSPRDTAQERRNALVNAAVAGGVTYGVSNYTDWGKENLAPIDARIKNTIMPTPDPSATVVAGATSGTGTTSSITDALKKWAVPSAAALGVASLSSGGVNWLLVGGGVLAVVLLLR